MSNRDTAVHSPRVVVVHEWFAAIGGSENVAKAMIQAFPGSEMFCLWRSEGADLGAQTPVTESILARGPFRGRKVLSLPLMPIVWRNTGVRSSDAQIALVSSHLFAHHVRLPRQALKLVYVHTPARYIWEPALDDRGQSPLARLASGLLKPLDRRRAQEATELAANSHFVKERIERAWGRQARVIYPPVDIAEIRATSDWCSALGPDDRAVLDSLPSEFILGASRFVTYKGLDVVIKAGEVAGIPVVLAGGGPDENRLHSLASAAKVPVTIVGRPSTELLRAMYQRALLYVFPPVEDFGIMPVEAMAAGTPVLANRVGGASESVIEGNTGALFDPLDHTTFSAAIGRALSLERSRISDQTVRFSRQRFQEELRDWVAHHVEA